MEYQQKWFDWIKNEEKENRFYRVETWYLGLLKDDFLQRIGSSKQIAKIKKSTKDMIFLLIKESAVREKLSMWQTIKSSSDDDEENLSEKAWNKWSKISKDKLANSKLAELTSGEYLLIERELIEEQHEVSHSYRYHFFTSLEAALHQAIEVYRRDQCNDEVIFPDVEEDIWSDLSGHKWVYIDEDHFYSLKIKNLKFNHRDWDDESID